MTRVFSPVLLLVLPWCLCGAATHAQTSEDHGVIKLTRGELGPYRPQHKPDIDETVRLIRQQTNEFRKSHKCEAVETDKKLQATAEEFAAFMARNDFYGHRADGHSPDDRAKSHDYQACLIAENIAFYFATEGFKTKALAKQAVEGWINSPPHRENMLRPGVTQIGIGIAQSTATGAFYAVQLFGRPQSQAISFQIKNETKHTIRYVLGDRTFSLPIQYTRMHQMCVPATLRLKPLDDTAADDALPSIEPHNGDEFVVTQDDGKLLLSKSHVDE